MQIQQKQPLLHLKQPPQQQHSMVSSRGIKTSSQIKRQQQFFDSLENYNLSDSSQFGDNSSIGVDIVIGSDGNSGSPETIFEDTRVITIITNKSTNLGISLMGGNAVGIFVHDVQKKSLADTAGMRKADHVKYKLIF